MVIKAQNQPDKSVNSWNIVQEAAMGFIWNASTRKQNESERTDRSWDEQRDHRSALREKRFVFHQMKNKVLGLTSGS